MQKYFNYSIPHTGALAAIRRQMPVLFTHLKPSTMSKIFNVRIAAFFSLFALLLMSVHSWGQPCSHISGNVTLGGAAHNPGFQEIHPVFAAARLSNDNFVTAWTTRDAIDGDSTGCFFQVFDPSGMPVSSVVIPYTDINPSGTGAQGLFGPMVAALSNGFVMAWESEDGPGDTGAPGDDQQDVYFRVYDNAGSPTSGTTRISVAAQEDQLEFLLPLENGGFVVLIRIDEDAVNNDDYYFQAFNATGMAASPLTNVSGGLHDAFFQTTDNQHAMADLGNSRFGITWEARDGADGDREGGYFRIFNTDGTPVTDVIMPYADINPMGTGSQGTPGPRMIRLAGGNLVVAWESEDGPGDEGPVGDDQLDTYFRVYSPAGAAVSGTVKANDLTGQEDKFRGILALEGGNFVIAFSPDKDLTGNTDDIYVRVFNASGAAVSAGVEVSGGTQTDVYNVLHTEFGLAALSNGNFVVGWGAFSGPQGDGNGAGSFHRVFNSTGGAVTPVTLAYADINPMGTGDQSGTGPVVTALENGFTVVWNSIGGPGDAGPTGKEEDTYHRVYDNMGAPLCGSIKTNSGNDADEESVRFVTALHNGNFAVIYKNDEDVTNKDDYFLRVIGGTPPAFTCPTIGAASPSVTTACEFEFFTVTATGLSDMAMSANGEQNFGIRFVLFDSPTDDPYTGGISLSSIPFDGLGANGTTAMSNEFGISAGPNQIYAVLQPAPADSDCRPYAVTTVNIATSPASFSLSSTVCLNTGVQNGLEGGSPAGGVYSGPGVTDNGNGSTFNFDPAAAGTGTHTITYTLPDGAVCGVNVATATIEVVAVPEVTFSSSLSNVNITDGVQSGATGGSPAGGVYSGPGVTDNGNGMTFSFDPATAGVGMHTVTYTFTNTAGCTAAATAEITVEQAQALDGDICTDAIAIDSLFGGALNVPVVSGLQDNTGYNGENDPGAGYECWIDAEPQLTNTIWYTFTGDGNKYRIRTVVCNTVNPILNNDTQFALYSGSCDELTALVCSEDENFDANLYNGFLEIETVAGVEYRLMTDGFVQPDYVAVGAFCLEVTLLETVAVTDIEDTPFKVFPNPTSGTVRFDGFTPDWVTVTDQLGRSLREWRKPVAEINLDGLPAGMYLLQMGSGSETYMARLVKD